MVSPHDIRPGSLNGILGVAMQMPCDATLTADECRELYDYVNWLEHIVKLTVRHAAQGVGVVVEGEDYPDPEKAEGPEALLPKPSEHSLRLTKDEANVVRFGAMAYGGEARGRPFWDLAKAKRLRERWYKKQEKRHAEYEAERKAEEAKEAESA